VENTVILPPDGMALVIHAMGLGEYSVSNGTPGFIDFLSPH